MPHLKLAAAVLVLSAACASRVEPTNPYDPKAPPDRAAKGSLRGKLSSPALTPPIAIKLSLVSANNQSVAQVTTSADGTFLIPGLVPGQFTLQATPDGFAPLSLAVALAAGSDVDLGTIDLVLGQQVGTLRGVATLSGGDSSGIVVQTVERAFSTLTDGTGNWQLSVPQGSYTLRFTHKDYLATTLQNVAVQTGSTANVAAVALPINPAQITGIVQGELPDGTASVLDLATVTLDGTAITGSTVSGSFTLTGIPAGSYSVRAFKPGYQSNTQAALNLQGGEARTLPAPLILKLARGSVAGAFKLAGVTDSSGIAVTLHSATLSVIAITAADGSFTASGLPVGTYFVDAAKPPEWKTTSLAGIVVSQDATTQLPGSPLSLQPVATASLSGTVLLEGQSVASGTTVSLSGSDFRGVPVTGNANTDIGGNFSFSALAAGAYQLKFTQTGFDSPPLIGVAVVTGQAASVGTLTLLASRGSVTGVVTATGAADLSGTVVNVSGGPDSAGAVTDASGRFRIDRLRVGTGYTAAFTRPGYAAALSPAFAITSGGLTSLTASSIALTSTGSISGSAAVARPVGGNGNIGVSLTGADINGAAVSRSTSTSSLGAYSLTGLPPGTYALTFTKGGYDPQTVGGLTVGGGAISPPLATLQVSNGSLTGSVALSSGTVTGFAVGTDFSGAVVTLSGTDVPVPSAITDSAGHYQFPAVPVSLSGAQFTVTASKPYFSSAATSVTAVANTAVSVSQTLTLNLNAGSLAGTALLNDNVNGAGANATSAGISISVSGTAFNGSAFSAPASTAADGTWQVGALPPGSYTALATSTNRSCATYGSATVAPGAAAQAGSISCVDALPPSTVVLGAPSVPVGAQPGYTSGSSVTVPVVTPAVDPTLPASNFRGYQLVLGASPNWSSATLIAGQPTALTFSGLSANSSNVLWARPIDWSGNAGPASSAVVVTDSIAPPAPTLGTPRSIVNATTTSVTLSGGEADTNFLGYETCSSAIAATGSCPSAPSCAFTSTPASFAVSLTANQQTCVYARSVDRAGNRSGSAQVGIISDLIAPTPPAFAPNYDPYKMTVRAPWVDFFNTSAATDAPGAGGPWQGIAWLEVDTGSGYQPLCPQTACQQGGAWSPCSCGCTDSRLRCDAGRFVGIRASVPEGTSSTIAFRAVDLAGNVGSGVSQQVFADSTGDVISANGGNGYSPTIRGTLVGYESYVVGQATGVLVDLGANRRFDSTDPKCVLSTSITTGLYRSVVPVHPKLVAFADSYSTAKIRRPGPDGVWCTGDDVTTTIATAAASTWIDGVVGAGEKLAWTIRDVNNNYTIKVTEPGPDGVVGTSDDITNTVATYSQLNTFDMAGNALLTRDCPSSCTWSVLNAGPGGSFFSGATTFNLTASSEVSLTADGKSLGWVEGSNFVILQAGPDGVFGTADDVTIRKASPYPLGGSVALDGLHFAVPNYGSTFWLVHWWAGPDGLWGTADDVVEQVHQSSVNRQFPHISDGLLVFAAGSDIQTLDLTALRWEAMPSVPLQSSGFPLAFNGAGTLFYQESGPLIARTAAGTETVGPSPRYQGAFAADRTQLLAWDGSAGVSVYSPDSSGIYFSATAPPPTQIYATTDTSLVLALGAGKAIIADDVAGTGHYKIFEPAGGLLKNVGTTGIISDPYPTGMNWNWMRNPAITAQQAFFACNGVNGDTCVVGAGPDGKFGTTDDVAAAYLVHPSNSARAGIAFSGASLVVSGNRMMISESFPPGMYLIDAGSDGLFNTSDDVERTLSSASHFDGQMSLAGSWAAYIDPGGTNGQQIWALSSFNGPPYLLTQYYSPKRSPVIDANGRVAWIDGVFAPEGIMVRTP